MTDLRRVAAIFVAVFSVVVGFAASSLFNEPSASAARGSTGTSQLLMLGGGGAGTANGDYVSDSAGLDTFYRFYVEVPPGLPRLNIEMFDADLGAGGAAEAAAGRDRARSTFDSSVAYSLINPSGQGRTPQFTSGNTSLPAGADNAWLSFYDTTGDFYLDTFTANSYSSSNGSVPWASAWVETNDNGNPGNGSIQIDGVELRIRQGGGSPVSISRSVDLSGNSFVGAVTFTFDRRTQNVESGDQMLVQISSNGGASWTTLETFTGEVTAGTSSYDVTAYRTANTVVRFIHGSGYSSTDTFWVDNARLAASGIEPGHWEIRVDMSSAVTGGDDLNALGIRAHDGTAGSGGTELNIYADSFYSIGANPPASGQTLRSYDLYPYITSGCSFGCNDFDYDSNRGNVGSTSLSSRTGQFTQSIASSSLSGDNSWARNTVSGWTLDSRSADYGIWNSMHTIGSYLVSGQQNGNYANLSFTNFAADANPPTANPLANAFRIYLPSDSGSAPVKPYLEQDFIHFGGPNPPVATETSVFRMVVRLVNPTPHVLTFSSPNNVVTANIPGSGTVYGGFAEVSQGLIVSEPSIGGTGNLTWNPGSVGPGETVVLIYNVDVTPSASGQRVPLTAGPTSGNGTRARFIDETGNSTQARATLDLGPICEIAVTEGTFAPLYNCGPFVSITPNSLPLASRGAPYNAALTPTAVTLYSGSLPPGLTLAGGVVSGTPTKVGTFTFVVGTPLNPGFSPSGCGVSKTYTIQVVNVTPTAGGVSVSGRAMDADGKAISRSVVTLTDMDGNRYYGNVNHFGYFRVPDVRAGRAYIINVRAKGYLFDDQMITVNEQLDDVVVVGRREQ
jgi:hypothetical protein